MNIKSILASVALLTTTTTAAMADVRVTGSVSGQVTVRGQVGSGVTVRDHRDHDDRDDDVRDHRLTMPPPVSVTLPKARDHRIAERDWDRVAVREWNHESERPAEPKLVISNPRINQTNSDYVGTLSATAGALFTQPTRIANQSEEFWIGAPQGRFNTVELDNITGTTAVTKILVGFADGSYQSIFPKTQVVGRSTLAFDLAGQNRAVARVIVYGSTSSNGAYQLALK